MSLARSEDAVRRMEAVGQVDLAAVVARNLSITRSLCAVDALLLVLRVREVRNFEWWVLGFCHYPINPGRFLTSTIPVPTGAHQHSPGSRWNRRASDPEAYC